MENEKILEKIKKLFELAGNNPSKEEATAAMLKAQELMVAHNISMSQVENTDIVKNEPMAKGKVKVTTKKWKYTLAQIVAPNFRCTHYWYGTEQVIFFGHKTDVMIAAETFNYLFNVGDKLANKLYREAKDTGEITNNIYNSCVMGFCQGIRDALAEQSKALMVVVPDDVKNRFDNLTKGFRTRTTTSPSAYRGDAYRTGKQAGYNAMRRNALEGGN